MGQRGPKPASSGQLIVRGAKPHRIRERRAQETRPPVTVLPGIEVPAAPEGLQDAEAVQLWADIHRRYKVTPILSPLTKLLCFAVQRAVELRQTIDRLGVDDAPRHLLQAEIATRTQVHKLMDSLGLEE